jgi:hypothetical protein
MSSSIDQEVQSDVDDATHDSQDEDSTTISAILLMFNALSLVNRPWAIIVVPPDPHTQAQLSEPRTVHPNVKPPKATN